MNQVVIVGAGPVGMTAADILSQQGINVTVLEKNDSLSKEWRASTFHAGTLELLESTGLTDELLKRGLKADKVQYRDRTEGLYAEFDFNQLKNETKYPFRLQCPQSTYVQVLNERLEKRTNVNIIYQAEVVEFTQDKEGVSIIYQTPQGKQEIYSKFLLGADGAKSTIRKKLGLNFEGFTYEERFLLIGTPIPFTNFLPDIASINYISDPEEFLFILRVPEAWRLLYPVPAHLSDQEALEDNNIQKVLQRALKTDTTFPIVERMIYKVHQRVAEKYYEGRIVLLGDAAHINSPMGGLGLNSGIHDSVDLSRRLLRIFEDENSNKINAELEVYNKSRRTVSLQYVRQISEKNTNVMKEKDPNYRKKLQQEYTELANDPIKSKEWMLKSAMISSVRDQGIGDPPKEIVK